MHPTGKSSVVVTNVSIFLTIGQVWGRVVVCGVACQTDVPISYHKRRKSQACWQVSTA